SSSAVTRAHFTAGLATPKTSTFLSTRRRTTHGVAAFPAPMGASWGFFSAENEFIPDKRGAGRPQDLRDHHDLPVAAALRLFRPRAVAFASRSRHRLPRAPRQYRRRARVR